MTGPAGSGSKAPDVTSVEARLHEALTAKLAPVRLDIVNESHLHAGHRSSPGTGNSHFRVTIVSQRFEGLNRVARHRLVNAALAGLIGNPIHALALETLAPEESFRP